MKLQYLGTAAAEAFPALFCQCETCKRAREKGGKDIRGRSGAVLDDTLMIDFPPDVYLHSLRFGIDLTKIENLIVTHSHMDHFCPVELSTASPDYYAHGMHPIHVFGNGNVGKKLENAMFGEFKKPVDFVPFQRVYGYQPFSVGGYEVTPLPALHGMGDPSEDAFFYLIRKDGKTLLYTHDTGIFFEPVFAYLKANAGHIDLVSLDCTFGKLPDGANHMGIPDNLVVKARLEEQGNVDASTRYIINHFSHNCHSIHEELEEEAAKHGFLVAYDGMTVEI
ncbi:MAG: MBL fold metallo-hydrolase [Eubacteriales bacterium]|nr:MBL fold metallo-hydrolase [Eubacteriales bacterium]